VLDANEEMMLAVRCEVFDPINEVLIGDRVTLVWTDSPDDTSKVRLMHGFSNR